MLKEEFMVSKRNFVLMVLLNFSKISNLLFQIVKINNNFINDQNFSNFNK